MLSLYPLSNLTRFRNRNNIFTNCINLVQGDNNIQVPAILLAARSPSIEEQLQNTDDTLPLNIDIPTDLVKLDTCVDLIYGQSVKITVDICPSIYEFGKCVKIYEMSVSVIAFLRNYLIVTCDKFWDIYATASEQGNNQVVGKLFVDVISSYLDSGDGPFFMQCTKLSFQDTDKVKLIVGLLAKVDDRRILHEVLALPLFAYKFFKLRARISSSDSAKYLETVICSICEYIQNYQDTTFIIEEDRAIFSKTIDYLMRWCPDGDIKLSVINSKIKFESLIIDPVALSTTERDRNWNRIRALTCPSTTYDTIKKFIDHYREQTAGTRIHPCVVMEIVLKWWRVSRFGHNLDTDLIRPLITEINGVSNDWYTSVCNDKRYSPLMNSVRIEAQNTVSSFISFDIIRNEYNLNLLKECIRTMSYAPVQLTDIKCSDNMNIHTQDLPAFRYTPALCPPYGHINHHWFIRTTNPTRHVSFIIDSMEELLRLADAKSTSLVSLDIMPPLNIRQ